jgi:hypothetical protein
MFAFSAMVQVIQSAGFGRGREVVGGAELIKQRGERGPVRRRDQRPASGK